MNNQRRRYDRWRDDQGTHLPDGCRIEQIGVHRMHGGARCRLGKQGVVIGRSQSSRLHIRFDGEQQTVSIRPYLVRVLRVTEAPALSTGQIISQLDSLRDLLPAPTGDNHG